MLSMHSAHIAITDFHSHRAQINKLFCLPKIFRNGIIRKKATKLVPKREQNERKNCFGIYPFHGKRNSFRFYKIVTEMRTKRRKYGKFSAQTVFAHIFTMHVHTRFKSEKYILLYEFYSTVNIVFFFSFAACMPCICWISFRFDSQKMSDIYCATFQNVTVHRFINIDLFFCCFS